MAHQEYYKPDSSDDEGSYEIIEWREFCLSTDSGYSSSEGDLEKNEPGSSYFEDDDEFDEDGTFCENIRQRGTSIRAREVVDIKEMVKEAVLPFLPAKPLARLKSVSKEWEQWIGHPFLAHRQSYCYRSLSGFFCQLGETPPTFQPIDPTIHGVPNHSMSFLPEPVTIMGSSNGLLLCQSRNIDDIVYYVCNPANKEWQPIPPSSYYHGTFPAMVLAFEPSELNFAANFSLVCAFTVTGSSAVSFEVYSSETRSWSFSSTYCFELGDPYGVEEDVVLKDGFYMKGSVYWRASSGKILVFDVKGGIYGILPLDAPGDGLLTWMSRELCYVRAHLLGDKTCRIDIHGGMNMVLKRSIELGTRPEFDEPCWVLACFDGKVLVVQIEDVVHCCDLETRQARVIDRRVSPGTQYLPYVNSLVSISQEG